ncbi:MAG: DUF5915 domain-containing protein, partial [Muribaculaceae bacterium]
FPADFIAEGVDQTRGWFFTLHAIAGMVFDSKAFKSVISNGLVLDKNGDKMSKRHGNSVDPFMAIEKFGSDPLRWYMIANSAPWENLKFNPDGVVEVSRKLFSTLANTYSFFALYANVDGFNPEIEQVPVEKRPEIDRWIISLLNTLIKQVTDSFEDLEPTKAARAINDFVIDNLSNWYVRLNRKRFWGGGMSEDKLSAYQTLYECLKTVAMLMAPVAPFYSDRLYQDLTQSTTENSVHLAFFPTADEKYIDKDLEERMALAQTITSMVLSLRRKSNLKVRQPLHAIMVPAVDDRQREDIELMSNLILTEVNVKELNIVGAEDCALVKRVKPDFKKLGPKLGKQMKLAAQALQTLEQKQIALFEKQGYIDLTVNGTNVRVDLADVEVVSEDIPGWLVANEGNVTVALDITVDEDLRLEGIAREIINRIQNIRKSRDYDITDRINVVFVSSPDIDGVVSKYGEYIGRQVLAESISVAENDNDSYEELDLDGFKVYVRITLN